MLLRVVPQLNQFQRLVYLLCMECRRRGISSETVTTAELLRMASTVPHVVKARDENGWRWEWPEDEQKRLTEVVWFNLWFFEQPMYAYNGFVDISQPEQTERSLNHEPVIFEG